MSPARSHNIFDYQKILAAVKELEESFADRIRKALEEKDKELKELEKILKQFLDGWDLIQVRRGGGKGSGFWKVEEKCLNIHQTKRRPEYREFLEQIKEQCQAILEVLK